VGQKTAELEWAVAPRPAVALQPVVALQRVVEL
jgi:hypothetical protein